MSFASPARCSHSRTDASAGLSRLSYSAIRLAGFLQIFALTAIAACNPTSATLANQVTGLQTVKMGQLTTMASGRTDKGLPGHGYTSIYEGFLVQWRYEPIRIMEIGIAGGGSLKLWYDYFPQASIFGIDIEDAKQFENSRVKTCIADQSKRDQLEKCVKQFGGAFDLLIDDGGHAMDQQQISLGYLFRYVKSNGFYFLEDIHTSLPEAYPGFGVSADEKNTTLTMLAKYIRSVPARFESKYMLPVEAAYLDAQVEYASLNFLNNEGHSIMCVIKKKAAP